MEGQRLLFDLALDNSDDGSSGTCRLPWNRLACSFGGRTRWGRAVPAR